MNKKLLILGVLCSLLLLGGCPIPLNVAICGNDICETGEQQVCPGDCTGITQTAYDTCDGDTCSADEYCPRYWLNDEHTLCSDTCETDSTSISLQSGWNYVSFPQAQLDEDIDSVIIGNFKTAVDSVYTYYNDQWYVWHSDGTPSNLETLEGGRGYVFYMNSAYSLSLNTLDSFVSSSDTIHSVKVYDGWNLIGVSAGVETEKEKPLAEYFSDITLSSLWEYASYYGSLSSVRTDTIDVSCSEYSSSYNMIPTHAYWIYATADGEITP